MSSIAYDSARSRRARMVRVFGQWLRYSLYAAIGAALLFGALLYANGSSSAWLAVSLAGPITAILIWQKDGLGIIPPGRNGTLDDVIEPRVLAYLPKEPTPRQLVEAAMHSQSAQFFVARFGLSPQFLHDLSSEHTGDSSVVLDTADNYRKQAGSPQISGGMIVAAVCVTQPQVKALLPHLQLDESDMPQGVRWHERLLLLIDAEKRPKRTGGIARDWSFGWANLLNRFGSNISDQVARGGLLHVRLDSHTQALQFLYDTFSSNGRQNAALIGPLGSGKSTIIKAFAESLLAADSSLPSSLKFRQVISLDASSLISASQSRSDLEGLVNQLFIEAYRAKNIILCLDDAQLFLEDRPGSVDLSSTLMPVIEGGGLRLILTMDEQRYLQIAQRNPALASTLNRLSVTPANSDETMQIMQDQIIGIEFQRNVTFMYQALKEAYRLSERYMYDVAQPGKSVRLLEQAAAYSEGGLVTANSISRCLEQTSGVKVGRVDTADEKATLLNLEQLIHERMINQTRAVTVVCDALRRARAGVRNETRPIGTFLFLGPTGVGKTELSKALAAVYFGGDDRLVRIDLNEYVRPDDVARLIADGAQDPRSLTAQIMKQPFSVVLLDEIEKAHPQVLTTLLQMLDEGILRDINNREVSFRDAIVIATSNAGADTIRELVKNGFQLEDVEAQFVDKLIDTGQFRPEFLNRFDEIVLFRPLNETELIEVVQLMVKGTNDTLASQKISIQLDEAASRKLASIGYDPQFGARPMRRMVQRTVENLIARKVLEGSAQPGDVITIAESDIQSGA